MDCRRLNLSLGCASEHRASWLPKNALKQQAQDDGNRPPLNEGYICFVFTVSARMGTYLGVLITTILVGVRCVVPWAVLGYMGARPVTRQVASTAALNPLTEKNGYYPNSPIRLCGQALKSPTKLCPFEQGSDRTLASVAACGGSDLVGAKPR